MNEIWKENSMGTFGTCDGIFLRPLNNDGHSFNSIELCYLYHFYAWPKQLFDSLYFSMFYPLSIFFFISP